MPDPKAPSYTTLAMSQFYHNQSQNNYQMVLTSIKDGDESCYVRNRGININTLCLGLTPNSLMKKTDPITLIYKQIDKEKLKMRVFKY